MKTSIYLIIFINMSFAMIASLITFVISLIMSSFGVVPSINENTLFIIFFGMTIVFNQIAMFLMEDKK